MFEEGAHHVVPRKQLLQELGLFMLHRLNDELIIAGEVEPGTAGAGVGQLDQGLITHGVLKFRVMQQSQHEQVLQSSQLKLPPHRAESE